ncbi:AsnC family transcriptional regulator [Flavobacterium sp. 90]|uniref:Lrp/AsnC family transcriptional regulator n=1 Tax=unclassified Flavobacterium TaxID=196869 RepID=UPI000EB3604E|nr:MULTISPECIES: Lrp/AsnC family transcriptional regulator [unclassified Flavobacterium]RKR05087.1 AsnC family transcriptional regulator [Flavobacterium sp. 81]TCK56403.1 AsnC family transcriptional regulator [Flavobacterium sp. 90]
MLDTFDHKILEIIQKNNQTPQRDIGETIGLSAAAVQRRIKKLRELGIIEKDIAVIDREKIGNNVTILVEVFLDSEKIELVDDLKKKFISIPEIQQCYYVTGESDFFLVIVVPSMNHYEILTRKIFFADDNIKRFRTIVVMGITKNSLEIPLNLLVPQG